MNRATPRDIYDQMNPGWKGSKERPDLVVNGHYLLGKDWFETAQDWRRLGHQVPPVIISVANRTETAARRPSWPRSWMENRYSASNKPLLGFTSYDVSCDSDCP